METRRSESFSNNTSSAYAPSSPTSSRARSIVFAMTLSLATACGASPSNGTDGGTGDLDASVTPDARTEVDAGPPGCTSDAECADAIDCTTDTCVVSSGSCRHTVTPALCAVGESCNPMTGCEPGRPCATDADCADDDACTTMERCDPAARVCTWVPLDGDGDGDPPRVCGGGDCDDSRADVNPAERDICASGVDEDCDGAIDERTDATRCAIEGFCWRDQLCGCDECPECPRCTLDRARFDACVTFNLEHVAMDCTNAPTVIAAFECDDGTGCNERDCRPEDACSCTSGRTNCYWCVDAQTDETNCGGCGRVCSPGYECIGGTCDCGDPSLTPCFYDTGTAITCRDLQADAMNCGACGRTCASSQSCVAGECVCPGGGALCAGACVDTNTDPNNCGACGRSCGSPSSMTCMGGTCVACGGAGQPCCCCGYGCRRTMPPDPPLYCTDGVCR